MLKLIVKKAIPISIFSITTCCRPQLVTLIQIPRPDSTGNLENAINIIQKAINIIQIEI
jgi:hypothetical protein